MGAAGPLACAAPGLSAPPCPGITSPTAPSATRRAARRRAARRPNGGRSCPAPLVPRAPRRRFRRAMCCPRPRFWPGIAAAAGADSITWLGHACFLIRLRGRTLLTDPYLTERASPLPWFGPERFAGAGPARRTAAADRRAAAVAQPLRPSRPARAGAPAGYQPHHPGDAAGALALPRAGRFAGASSWTGCSAPRSPASRITAAAGDPFQQAWLVRPQCQPVVRLPPAGAATGRCCSPATPPMARCSRRWRRLLPATGPGAGPDRRLRSAPADAGSHCTPEEGVQIGRDWGAKRLCGMHWGTIRLTDEPPFEPPKDSRRRQWTRDMAKRRLGPWRSARLEAGERSGYELPHIEGLTPTAVVWCIMHP